MSWYHSMLTMGVGNTNVAGQQAFLIIGDSLARGTSASYGTTPTAGTSYYYVRSTNTVVEIGSQDMILADLDNRPNIGSFAPQFAIDYNAATGKKAVMIPCGVGGTNFANQGTANDCWDPTVSGSLYAGAVADAHACMAVMGVAQLKGIIVNLGVNDARGAVALADIQTSINNFFTQLQIDFPNVPILIQQVGRSEVTLINNRIGNVRQYLKTVCLNNSNCFLLGSLLSFVGAGFIAGDLIHPTQAGNKPFRFS